VLYGSIFYLLFTGQSSEKEAKQLSACCPSHLAVVTSAFGGTTLFTPFNMWNSLRNPDDTAYTRRFMDYVADSANLETLDENNKPLVKFAHIERCGAHQRPSDNLENLPGTGKSKAACLP
jgi:hypothetical protein